MYEDRPAPFVLVSTDHGTMIVNRNDWSRQDDGVIGVAVEIFGRSHYDREQLELLCQIAQMRRESFGDGVFVIDGGANIGCYTLELARLMSGWGSVIAFEPQFWVFGQLFGNICIANCLNARPIMAALGKSNGVVPVPQVDPCKPQNFGGISLLDTSGKLDEVPMMTIDSLNLQRLDILKLDVEGMEIDALEGAQYTLKRCKPVVVAEHIICGMAALEKMLQRLDYDMHMTGMNTLAIHVADPVGKRIRWFDSEEAA